MLRLYTQILILRVYLLLSVGHIIHVIGESNLIYLWDHIRNISIQQIISTTMFSAGG